MHDETIQKYTEAETEAGKEAAGSIVLQGKIKNRPSLNLLAERIGKLLNCYSIEPTTFNSWKDRIYFNHVRGVHPDVRGYLRIKSDELPDEEAEKLSSGYLDIRNVMSVCKLSLCVWLDCPSDYMSESDRKIYIRKAHEKFILELQEMGCLKSE